MVTLSSEEFSFFDTEFNVALNSSLILTIFWYPNYKKIVKAFSKISKMIFDFQATITKQSSLQSWFAALLTPIFSDIKMQFWCQYVSCIGLKKQNVYFSD